MRLHRDAKAELIRTIPLFAACTPAEVARVEAIADEIDFRVGKELATENATGQEFVVVIEGTAEVRHHDHPVNTIGPREFFGEIALITGQPRTATVVATSPVHALVIEGHAFRQLLAEAPDIRAKVEQAAADRLRRNAEVDQAGT